MFYWSEQWNLLELNEITVCLRLLLALICGGMLGLERTRKRRPAGLRTYMLVCIGATSVMMTAQFMYQHLGGDPGRMPAQVVCGIGFLGAGTIMVTRYYKVKGLTTAAGLWVSACIGLALGIGFYIGGLVTTLILLMVMVYADRFEEFYTRRLHRIHLYIIFDDIRQLKPFLQSLREEKICVGDVETSSAPYDSGVGVFCLLKFPKSMTCQRALELVEKNEHVLFVDSTDE